MPSRIRHQGWYKHIGLGRNIRTADLPLPYTKRMAHLFLQAPDHFTVEMALRWGQVRGLGGSEVLASAVAATRLGRSFEHEDFWQTVLHFFVNEPMLDPVARRPHRGLSQRSAVRAAGGFSSRRVSWDNWPSPAESDNEGTHPEVALEAGRGVAQATEAPSRSHAGPLEAVGHRRVSLCREGRAGPRAASDVDNSRVAEQWRAIPGRACDAALRCKLCACLCWTGVIHLVDADREPRCGGTG